MPVRSHCSSVSGSSSAMGLAAQLQVGRQCLMQIGGCIAIVPNEIINRRRGKRWVGMRQQVAHALGGDRLEVAQVADDEDDIPAIVAITQRHRLLLGDALEQGF